MQDKLFVLPVRHPAEPGTVSKHTLPAQLTPLIGREHEQEAICTLLRHAAARLVTLTGTGGVGKTRLALEVAQAVRADFTDGVCLVELAPVSDPARVMAAIAQALGLWEAGDLPVEEQVHASCRDRHLLLLLDNFEQVVEAAPYLASLLASCPRLSMLVTSRTTLHLSGEHEFAVPPLEVPDLTQLPETQALTQLAAVRLFVERAHALQPTFQLTEANARTIAEICVRLDGLPLAIELAAARIKLLPPLALLKRLSRRLDVLTSGTRDLPTRQQTLRNTIQWSYDLLSQKGQRLFRWLSIFVGGCTLEAVAAVCLADQEQPMDVLDGVTSLVDKSLVQQTEWEGEEPRLVMLETIREFGLECLTSSGEWEGAQQAHAAYYLHLAEEAAPRLSGTGKGRWLEGLQREHENQHAALAWFVEHNEQEAALRLGLALWRFWWMRGHLSEGRSELARALAGSREVVATPVRAKALHAAGALAGLQGDFEQAEALCGESLALFRAQGDLRGSATSLSTLGYAAIWQRSDYMAARALLEEAVTLFRAVDDKYDISSALVNLATTCTLQGEYDRARTLLEEAVVLDREGGDSWNITNSLWHLAMVMHFQEDLTRAPALLEESLAFARQEGYTEAIAHALFISGQTAMMQRDVATARPLLEESRGLFTELGDRQNLAQSLIGLAGVSFMQSDYTEARALFEESLALSRAIGNKWFIAVCLVGLGAVAGAQGEAAWAARLSGAAEALCKAINAVLPPALRAMREFTIATARTHLGEEVFTAAWAEGCMMTPEQALVAQGRVTVPTTAPAGPPTVPHAPKVQTYPNGLTAREVEVLRLVAQGMTNEQLAKHLVISPRTVNTHLTSIFSKIGVSTRSAATRYAIDHHLV